jgi:L-fuculose-phosphate aldolase
MSKSRRFLIETARLMNACGLNKGCSGNLSLRERDGFLITPSGMDYEALTPKDIVFMDFDGKWQCANPVCRPSSEWRFHLDILKARPEFNAVLHCHSRHATAMACQGRGIPAFHYMVAMAGGDAIDCAPYATFGTAALSRHALKALAGRKACLLANHGMIACGKDLPAALALAQEVEELAAQYLLALSTGKPKLLSRQQMGQVLKKVAAGYGYGSSAPPQKSAAAPSKRRRAR